MTRDFPPSSTRRCCRTGLQGKSCTTPDSAARTSRQLSSGAHPDVAARQAADTRVIQQLRGSMPCILRHHCDSSDSRTCPLGRGGRHGNGLTQSFQPRSCALAPADVRSPLTSMTSSVRTHPSTTVTDPSAAGGPRHAADGHALMAQLGSEVASALSSALESVNTLATTGKISRKDLRELRENIELARRTGIMGQQVHRLASGRVRQAVERVDLTAVLRDALLQHRRQVQSLGFEVHQALGPAQVMADPALAFTLVEALLEWAFEHTRSAIELRIDLNPWPVFARLSASFRFVDDSDDARALAQPAWSGLYTMSWRLLEQTAHMMELPIGLHEEGETARLLIEFPRAVNDPVTTSVPAGELSEPDAIGLNSKPLAGSHVLVIASRRESRAVVRDALRHMGLMIDYVASVAEAREFCEGGLPHAVLYDSSLGGERFDRLRMELLADMPHLVFIELCDDGQGVSTQQSGQRRFSRVSLNSAIESLPPTLMFELTQPK